MDHTATKLRAGYFGIQTLAGARDSSLLFFLFFFKKKHPIQWIMGGSSLKEVARS